mgnify:CR=1 FL=1
MPNLWFIPSLYAFQSLGISEKLYALEKGKVKNVKVLRGVHKSLDRASMRLVKSSEGLWTPGKIRNRPCSKIFLVPVIWQLPIYEDDSN